MESKTDSLFYSLDRDGESKLSTIENMVRPCRSYIECKRLKRLLFGNANFIGYSKFFCDVHRKVFLKGGGKRRISFPYVLASQERQDKE